MRVRVRVRAPDEIGPIALRKGAIGRSCDGVLVVIVPTTRERAPNRLIFHNRVDLRAGNTSGMTMAVCDEFCGQMTVAHRSLILPVKNILKHCICRTNIAL